MGEVAGEAVCCFVDEDIKGDGGLVFGVVVPVGKKGGGKVDKDITLAFLGRRFDPSCDTRHFWGVGKAHCVDDIPPCEVSLFEGLVDQLGYTGAGYHRVLLCCPKSIASL